MDPAPRTARAVVLDRPGSHRLVRGPAAVPGPHEVRVAVRAAALSAEDRALFEGTHVDGLRPYPLTPGKAWSGRVEACGSRVPVRLLGRAVAGGAAGGGGACADVVTVTAGAAHPLPDAVDARAAALLGPAASAAAAVHSGRPAPGERVAVLGAGTTGLLALRLLAACAPGELLAVDPRVRRAEYALTLGADDATDPVGARNLRGRYDLVVDTTARGAAPRAAPAAGALAGVGGRTVRTGAGAPTAAAWTEVIGLFAAGWLELGALVSGVVPLTEFGEAMARSADPRRLGRVLLRP
ncbi:alcohol dehydrogenase catalytic domain-containing protein [Streptomyces sp. TRM70308]|uniref:alcohol dehydrogenase catalytic domain-containing protein n=1 Tax=Streptomyces sp. TRM70308 TaxID=3131932 RepID=UPI003CFFF534